LSWRPVEGRFFWLQAGIHACIINPVEFRIFLSKIVVLVAVSI